MLVGATTENPSFELNGALLSRAQVLVFKPLDDAALGTLLERAEAPKAARCRSTTDARAALSRMADGDGRSVLNLAEEVWRAARHGDTVRRRRPAAGRCSTARRSTTRRRTATTI